MYAPGQVPRCEYPRPQFVRDRWLCLNGSWEFEIDSNDDGLKEGLLERGLKDSIVVPFCPESKLSGHEIDDFMPVVWYRREFELPEDWKGSRVLLNFQAVDYEATVWVNGTQATRHKGGFTPFSQEISALLHSNQPNAIVLRVRDSPKDPQARGKQSRRKESYGVFYKRTTGIWQTVWLEPVSDVHFLRPRITPSVEQQCLDVHLPLSAGSSRMRVVAELSDDLGTVQVAYSAATSSPPPRLRLTIPLDRIRLWRPEDPFLYGLQLKVLDEEGTVIDRLNSYAGLRAIAVDSNTILLNGEPIFLRFVLDQGYYPDGVMTAPSDLALKNDIDLAKGAGFNGARLHQKVFEERFLFHADKAGYLVWGEFADWGIGTDDAEADEWEFPETKSPRQNRLPDVAYMSQWHEVLERDFSHPCIIAWCPLNETDDVEDCGLEPIDDLAQALFIATKSVDPTRPVLDVSGFNHRIHQTDIYDQHLYYQDPEELRRAIGVELDPTRRQVAYGGQQPLVVSEFGGIHWVLPSDTDQKNWGYGERPLTADEWHARFSGLVKVLVSDRRVAGYCYTQLTDVLQERNGIYFFDRKPKFESEKLRLAQSGVAENEKMWRRLSNSREDTEEEPDRE